MWNDGPSFEHLLSDPDCPVPNRNICFGGGGGGTYNAPLPQVPDYSQYISAMSSFGNQGQSWASNLQNWASSMGVNLSSIAGAVSGAAGTAAGTAGTNAGDAMGLWKGLSTPLYQAQQGYALNLMGNLPQTEDEWAGKYASDAAQSADQQKQQAILSMQQRGLAPNAAATGALDTEASFNRSLATTTAAENGRVAAINTALGATSGALGAEATLPGVSAQQQGIQLQGLGLQTSAPNAAATATSGLYSPSLGYYSAAYPYMSQWGNMMSNSFNQNLGSYSAGLQAYKANEEAGANSPLSTIGALGAGIVGSYLGGPAGGMIGSSIGGMLGKAAGGNTAAGSGSTYAHGGVVGRRVRFAKGGAIDTSQSAINQGHLVPPEASPSGGQNTDDVNAMVSEGEFIMPERTVDWLGEKFFQNLIAKVDREAQHQTVAEGEDKPVNPAIMTQPPMFHSEGARV